MGFQPGRAFPTYEPHWAASQAAHPPSTRAEASSCLPHRTLSQHSLSWGAAPSPHGPGSGLEPGVCPEAAFVLTSHQSPSPTDPTAPIPSIFTTVTPIQAATISHLIHISSP